ncbi:DUF4879 domain-containing protein [Chondromyces apiculatus]|uniref:DUF4879 domain-containing protein n=1 Tax=Chondromyces apiculatus DSM 436 TaxID=1192034 RepID=A0A017SWL1_9BACT|nr:DUF4879 domain-containing protein [Chondromyces apiculatus]EYF00985.1 Hypothetical protein CAP_8853 [Chondromyces apiculatus DSM 436]
MLSSLKFASAALVVSSTLLASSALSDPAPPLTYLQITGVLSEDDYLIYGDWENIAPTQTTTLGDHGGSEMYVETFEYGYGTLKYATMDGVQVYEVPGSAYAITDSNNVIVGWYRYWDLSGSSGGAFYYQTRSINSPFNLMSDTLTIQ